MKAAPVITFLRNIRRITHLVLRTARYMSAAKSLIDISKYTRGKDVQPRVYSYSGYLNNNLKFVISL